MTAITKLFWTRIKDGRVLPIRSPGTLPDPEIAKEAKEVALGDFDIFEIIGKGSFAKVYLCRKEESKHFLAIKVIDITDGKNHFDEEASMMHVLEHPLLMSAVYSFKTSKVHCIVMPLLIGDMFQHLECHKFSQSETRFYGAEIVSAVGYLHSINIVHRDVKLQNIMFHQSGHIKLGDFGLCIKCTDGQTMSDQCGTPLYRAPEMFEGTGYGRGVDWWATGVALFRMITHDFPFKFNTNLFKDGPADVEFDEKMDADTVSLLKGPLTKNPIKRLGCGPTDCLEIQSHSFFGSVEWGLLVETSPPFTPEFSSKIKCFLKQK